MSSPKTATLKPKERALLRRFSLALRDLASFSKETPLLIAVSGGRDSVVLLHLLLQAGYNVQALCHLNHGLRGKASDLDEKFVEKLGLQYKMRVIFEKISLTPGKGGSLETVARKARQAFFARVAMETGVNDLVLGHHADDQAETFLWNLLRGSGREGMGAMQPVTGMEIDGQAIRLHRPLLGIWREEIDEYVALHGLKFREDASNRSKKHTRNQLRHEIIPWLEKKLGRNVRAPLWRTAEIMRAENEWLEELAGEFPPAEPLLVADLKGKAVAWQRRRIHAWLVANRVERAGFAEVEAVRSLLDSSCSPARTNLPGDVLARRRAGKITIA